MLEGARGYGWNICPVSSGMVLPGVPASLPGKRVQAESEGMKAAGPSLSFAQHEAAGLGTAASESNYMRSWDGKGISAGNCGHVNPGATLCLCGLNGLRELQEK